MFKNKKWVIAISIIILIILLGLAYFLYYFGFFAGTAAITALNGQVRAINGNTITIMASVPEARPFFANGGAPNYVSKEYLLKINPDSKIYMNEIKIDGNYLTEQNSMANLKVNSVIDARVKEDILKNKELNVVELTIIQ